MKKLIIVVFSLITIQGFTQQKPDSEFLEYLLNKEFYKEVLFLSNQKNFRKLKLSLQDSLHYFKGWSLYSQKKLFQSAQELSRVSLSSPFYHKSHFFAAYSWMHIENYDKSLDVLDTVETEEKNLQTLKHFEKAGLALLNRNYKEFDHQMNRVDTNYYAVAEESAQLNQYATDLRHHNHKSPVLASIMSGIIPGSGKIYAGETGSGISSLLTVGGLGFVTWENYRKKGPTDIKTLFFGAVFSAFYIGNIYGSYFSVKITEDEFQKGYNNKILFNLHIPLRNVFN